MMNDSEDHGDGDGDDITMLFDSHLVLIGA